MMTEAEAKTRWCPHARVGRLIFSRVDDVVTNRILARDGTEQMDHSRCIGSGCMSWRWAPPRPKHPSAEVYSPHTTEDEFAATLVKVERGEVVVLVYKGEVLPPDRQERLAAAVRAANAASKEPAGYCGLAGKP